MPDRGKCMFKLISLLLLLTVLNTGLVRAEGIANINVNGKIYQAKEGSYLVKYKASGIRAHANNRLHGQANAKVLQRFSYPEGLELIQVMPGANSTESLKAYRASGDVEYVEPNYIWYANALPNDTLFPQQWALNNIGQSGGVIGADANVLPGWLLTTGDKRVVVGVIDTGVDYSHPDLSNSMWVNNREIPGNRIDDDQNGFIDDVHGINAITGTGNPMDDNMHGTHVAGIIGAQQNNARGVSGIAPNISVAACKFLDASGSGSTASAITCLNYFRDLSRRSQNPVKMVATNNSWAGGPYSQALYDAIADNRRAGILFIAAASNEGQNNDVVNTYPANYFLSNVISVAATNRFDTLPSFSNYGRRSVSVAAPGVDILNTVPRGGYASLSGTSMAAPHVAGLAGLVASYYPNLSWVGIKNRIIAGGESTPAARSATSSGRRIAAYGENGVGSLTCINQQISARILPRASSVTMRLGQRLLLGILSINCEVSNRTSSMLTVSNGIRVTALTLQDNGLGYDQVASDGVFTGIFTASTTGNYTLRFPNNDAVSIRVIR